MRNIYLIARREFLSYVATWGFWLSLASVPLFMGLGFGLPMLIESSQPTRHYVIVDESGGQLEQALLDGFARAQEQQIADIQEAVTDMVGDNPQVQQALASGMMQQIGDGRYQRVDLGLTSLEDLRPYLLEEQVFAVDGEETSLFAAVFLRGSVADGIAVDYWSKNRTDGGLRSSIRRALEDYMQEAYLLSGGVAAELLESAEALEPEVRELNPERSGADAAVTDAERIPFVMGIAVAFGLWIIIFSVVNMLLTAMIEEKGNKVLEMMMSATRHYEILTGKLLGVACVSATLLVFWMGLALGGATLVQQAAASADIPVAEIFSALLDPGLLLPALGYFVIGYLMYGAVFLAVGSLCDTIQDAQTLMSPIMLIMMVPLFLVMLSADSPDSPIVAIASWVPVWTPFIMLSRLPHDPPMIELVGTTTLMMVTAIGVIWGAGAVFRLGSLNQANQETIKGWFSFGKKS
ncbi:MAG: ABC transporter permease [Pseudomonadota bacterium]|nr:ABC transporter permease [Pseudomonadota bacterium]